MLAIALFAIVAAAPSDDATTDARVQRVVRGLLPDTAFRNRYGPPASLAERMAHYHTPGVSVAVVNDGRIEWARAFGVRERGRSEPVSERTLFQAGSISKPIFALGVMRLVQEGRLMLELKDQPAVALRPTGVNAFQAADVNAEVVFDKDDGAVKGLTLTQAGRGTTAERK